MTMMPSDHETICRVCGSSSLQEFARVQGSRYLRCIHCQATLLSAHQLPGLSDEHAYYQRHDNHAGDVGYRRFVSRAVVPLLDCLPSGASGLDYGCGADSAVAAMLREAGYWISLYDPLFFPDSSLLAARYDFITCTEVIEHFHQPTAEFAKLDAMLKPGGWLALLTCFQTDDARFANWHYRRDPTHVVFYREHTLQTIARQYGWRCHIPVKDVALMQKLPVCGGISLP